MPTIGGTGVALSLRGQNTNAVTLPAGGVFVLPSGNFAVTPGAYTSLQFKDPITGIWRTIGATQSHVPEVVQSDGTNIRLANLTGCPVAAVITTALATGATTGIGATATSLTVTPSSGASVWVPIVGGALSLTCVTGVTGSTVGAGYLYPPTCVISAPPPGGLQATAHCTVTGGTLLAAQVTIDNQGAGYPVKSTGLSTATITFINDPRDNVGSGATVLLGATGTGLLTGLYPSNQGVPLTGVPTLAFSVGAAGATAIMNFTVTAIASGATNSATYATGTTPIVTSIANIVSDTPAWTNPIHEKGATFPRPARIQAALNSNAVTGTGAVVEDGGFGIQKSPTLVVNGQLLAITGVTGSLAPVASVGGVTDTSWYQAI